MRAASDAIADLVADEDIASAVTYSRGSDSQPGLAALVENLTVEEPSADGEFVRFEIRAFLILSDDLEIGLPVQGDLLQDALGILWEVNSPPGGRACYDWADESQAMIRVYTKRIGSAGS